MIYLKEYNEYENIDRHVHFNAVRVENREYFTKLEVMYLINLFNEMGVEYYFREVLSDGLVSVFDKLKHSKGGNVDKLWVNIKYKYMDYHINIHKGFDEWFYLKWVLTGLNVQKIPDGNYYRCDQLSGVKFFIENFLDIIKN